MLLYFKKKKIKLYIREKKRVNKKKILGCLRHLSTKKNNQFIINQLLYVTCDMALAQRSIKLIINMLDNIRFLIKKYDLDTPSRLREKSYQRFFMYDQLYPMMTLSKIGELFNRDHATVLKGIREARLYEQARDKYYLDIVKEVRKDLCGTGSEDDVQRVTAGVYNGIYKILLSTQDDPFDVVALEISLSVLDMIIGTQQGFHADFWKGVRENMKEKCNVLKKDALS